MNNYLKNIIKIIGCKWYTYDHILLLCQLVVLKLQIVEGHGCDRFPRGRTLCLLGLYAPLTPMAHVLALTELVGVARDTARWI